MKSSDATHRVAVSLASTYLMEKAKAVDVKHECQEISIAFDLLLHLASGDVIKAFILSNIHQ